MLIALIKYKRLMELVVQHAKLEVNWRNFLLGTSGRSGRDSVLQKIR